MPEYDFTTMGNKKGPYKLTIMGVYFYYIATGFCNGVCFQCAIYFGRNVQNVLCWKSKAKCLHMLKVEFLFLYAHLLALSWATQPCWYLFVCSLTEAWHFSKVNPRRYVFQHIFDWPINLTSLFHRCHTAPLRYYIIIIIIIIINIVTIISLYASLYE